MLERCFVGHKRGPGFALISSIAAITLVLMLLGAFFMSHRGFVSLSRQSDDMKACRDTLLALSDYCFYRLEKDKGWTTTPFDTNPEVLLDNFERTVLTFELLTPEQYNARPELHSLEGLAHVVGTMPANGVQYHMAVSNYLNGPDATSSDGVVRKSCRVRIEARRGTASQKLEFFLKKSAFFDSTVFASEKIDIEADIVAFNSEDPVRNQIRSLHSIELPDETKLFFREGETNPPASKGTVWAQDPDAIPGDARGSITLGGDASPEKLLLAASVTQAEFFPNDVRNYDPPTLEKDDLNLIGEGTEIEVDPAVYNFSNVTITYTDTVTGELNKVGTIKALQRFQPVQEPANPDFPLEQGESPTDVYFLESALPENADPDSVVVPLPPFVPGDIPIPGAVPTAFSEDRVDIAGGPTVTFLLPPADAPPTAVWQPKLSFPADQQLRIRGDGPADFSVISTANVVPDIVFENSDGTAGKGLIHADRDIVLQGRLGGSAQLIAGRDIAMIPNDVEVLADVEGDLALFAGGSVNIAPLYTDNSSILSQGGFFTFRGLVYAKKDFTFTGSVQAFGGGYANYNRRLDIQGALVAREGSVSISGNSRTAIRYDPAYLDSFLEDDLLDNKVQLEELSWRWL
jgi:hypothetical protein